MSTLCTLVENDFSLTSCESAMKCGSDSSHSSGISSSLFVYTRTSKAPAENKCEVYTSYTLSAFLIEYVCIFFYAENQLVCLAFPGLESNEL